MRMRPESQRGARGEVLSKVQASKPADELKRIKVVIP